MSAPLVETPCEAGPSLADTTTRRRAKELREILRNYRPVSLPINAQDKRQNFQLPHDIVLTSLAQLAAARMKCRRSFISLFDQSHQYILAEGVNGGRLGPTFEGKVVGDAMFDASRGVCPATVEHFTKNLPASSTETMSADSDHYVVADLTKEPILCDSFIVKQHSHELRYYCEIPLRNPAGLMLGTLCVINNEPREGVSEEDIAFMKEIGDAIMVHLELVGTNSRLNRAEHLIKGLGLFVEGKSSLRNWWLSDPENARNSEGVTAQERHQSLLDRADKTFGAPQGPDPSTGASPNTSLDSVVTMRAPETAVDLYNQDSRSCGVKIPTTNSVLHTTATPATSISPLGPSSHAETAPTESGYGNKDSVLAETTDIPRASLSMLSEAAVRLKAEADETRSQRKSKSATIGSSMSSNIRDMFSRASNLIREAVELEGVVFLDATASRPAGGGGGGSGGTLHAPNGVGSHESAVTSSEDEKARSSIRTNGLAAAEGHRRASCSVLGYSTRTKSSLIGNKVSPSTPTMSVDVLQRFLRRYPAGTVFTFDRDGLISSSDEEMPSEQSHSREAESQYMRKSNVSSNSKRKRRQDAELLFRTLPGVRSVAFFPLWDFHKERWYAGTLFWTTDANRLLDEDDLTYFSAFGNSTMAEISRIEAISSDRAKSDFISSISHELRSPLHGKSPSVNRIDCIIVCIARQRILGSAELLRDISSDPVQNDMVRMIEVCGRTLLDTMDHLLDHAKINHLITNFKQPKENGKKSPRQAVTLGRVIPLDMADLVEDVVRTVYAGHTHSSSSSSLFHMTEMEGNAWSRNSTHSRRGSEDGTLGTITQASIQNTMIILSVSKRSRWCFSTEPGAWKRLLMNVFGNSLKYTQSGSILIRLDSEDVNSTAGDEPIETKVTLSVTDTGRGMSNNYLRHHLFKPFSQENDLDVGVGLGLSIVHQIATSIGGTVDLQSELGLGTKIAISAVLDPVLPASGPESRFQRALDQASSLCSGKEACLVGFDLMPAKSETPGKELSALSRQLIVLKAALVSVLTDHLNMTIATSQSIDSSTASIIFVNEHYLSNVLSTENSQPSEHFQQSKPWIVFCSESSAPQYAIQQRYDIEHPFTPIKIAQAICYCLGSSAALPSRSSVTPPRLVTRLSPRASNKSRKGNAAAAVAQQAFQEAKDKNNSPPTKKQPSLNRKTSRTVNASLSPTRQSSWGHEKDPRSLNSRPKSRIPTVLIVDDNIINVKLLTGFMRKLKCDYETASNGADAVSIYEKSAPKYFTLIFMDISMPVMDGFEATRLIRGHEKNKKLTASRIVALTGLGSAEAKQEASACGVDIFFTKPVGFGQLEEIMKDHVPGEEP